MLSDQARSDANPILLIDENDGDSWSRLSESSVININLTTTVMGSDKDLLQGALIVRGFLETVVNL